MVKKKGKLETPVWIKEGYDSPEEYEKAHGSPKSKNVGKVFKVRRCPDCGSDDVGVLLGKEEGKGKGEWQCKQCDWQGTNIRLDELTEEEFMKYLDEKGEEVA